MDLKIFETTAPEIKSSMVPDWYGEGQISAAVPVEPLNIFLSSTIAHPSPVPKVKPITFFRFAAAPKMHSPNIRQLASLFKQTGTPKQSSMVLRRGKKCMVGNCGHSRITPPSISNGPVAPMPIPITSLMDNPVLLNESSTEFVILFIILSTGSAPPV